MLRLNEVGPKLIAGPQSGSSVVLSSANIAAVDNDTNVTAVQPVLTFAASDGYSHSRFKINDPATALTTLKKLAVGATMTYLGESEPVIKDRLYQLQIAGWLFNSLDVLQVYAVFGQLDAAETLGVSGAPTPMTVYDVLPLQVYSNGVGTLNFHMEHQIIVPQGSMQTEDYPLCLALVCENLNAASNLLRGNIDIKCYRYDGDNRYRIEDPYGA